VFEAGAEHLVATLWEIPDEFTVQLMDRFYREILADRSPVHAMWMTKRDFFRQIEDEFDLSTAVFSAAPFFAVTAAAR